MKSRADHNNILIVVFSPIILIEVSMLPIANRFIRNKALSSYQFLIFLSMLSQEVSRNNRVHDNGISTATKNETVPEALQKHTP